MKVGLLLASYAVLLGRWGPAVLRKGSWTTRSPRLAIACWQALSVSVVTSVTLAGLVIAAPFAPLSTNWVAVVRACFIAIENGDATPAAVGASLAGLVLALSVVARGVGCLVAGLVRTTRERNRHLRALSLVTRSGQYSLAVVVDHATPAAYCLAGRHRRVVLTSGALRTLDDDQLQAVLAHEMAHLSGRHHLVLEVATTLHRAYPRIPLFSLAQREIARLVELVADDVAARQFGRVPVATAMVAMSTGEVPLGTLAAGGAGALERVRRLLEPTRPLRNTTVLAGIALSVAALVAPMVGALTPALAAYVKSDCPMTTIVAPLAMGSVCQTPAPLTTARWTTS